MTTLSIVCLSNAPADSIVRKNQAKVLVKMEIQADTAEVEFYDQKLAEGFEGTTADQKHAEDSFKANREQALNQIHALELSLEVMR